MVHKTFIASSITGRKPPNASLAMTHKTYCTISHGSCNKRRKIWHLCLNCRRTFDLHDKYQEHCCSWRLWFYVHVMLTWLGVRLSGRGGWKDKYLNEGKCRVDGRDLEPIVGIRGEKSSRTHEEQVFGTLWRKGTLPKISLVPTRVSDINLLF